MSWKACAHVKELRDNLIVTEKFVLLILAEYHRTDDKLAWPSVETLARDCLMTERAVYQILARLEEKDFIRRIKGGGRGLKSGYQIVGIDVIKGELETVNKETVFPETVNETLNRDALNPERNPAHPCSRYKEEPVLEPVLESNGEVIPANHPPLNYAVKIIEDLGLTDTNSNRITIEAAVRSQMRDGKSGPSAYMFLVAMALDAAGRGEVIDKFFFEDQKWPGGRGNGKRQTSNTGRRAERSVESLTDALRANRSRAASSMQG
jgi:Helix-turn-helix domain